MLGSMVLGLLGPPNSAGHAVLHPVMLVGSCGIEQGLLIFVQPYPLPTIASFLWQVAP